jgi:hypothetical protein
MDNAVDIREAAVTPVSKLVGKQFCCGCSSTLPEITKPPHKNHYAIIP